MLRTFRDAPLAPEMTVIERGYFRMGSESISHDMYLDEIPARECSVDERFAIGTFPVTFEEFAHFVCAAAARFDERSFYIESGCGASRLPVVMVSWHTARAYCAWLGELTGRTYRLPTEVEWEYACRAGTDTDYWWGDKFDPDRANSRFEEVQKSNPHMPRSLAEVREQMVYLTPVDKFEGNPWGLHDMLGNTWEWTADIYTDRRTDPFAHAPSFGQEMFRSTRGGSFMDPPNSLRCACRGYCEPGISDRNIGFRVARTL